MREIRIFDLNLVDRSDFIIAHIIPNVASWGSAEELVTAVRMKKPTFISVEGGKKECPLCKKKIEKIVNQSRLSNKKYKP